MLLLCLLGDVAWEVFPFECFTDLSYPVANSAVLQMCYSAVSALKALGRQTSEIQCCSK